LFFCLVCLLLPISAKIDLFEVYTLLTALVFFFLLRQPDISKFAPHVMPLLFSLLDQLSPAPAGVGITRAYYALENIVENLGKLPCERAILCCSRSKKLILLRTNEIFAHWLERRLFSESVDQASQTFLKLTATWGPINAKGYQFDTHFGNEKFAQFTFHYVIIN